MANLVVQISGGANQEPEKKNEAVYVDVGQHSRPSPESRCSRQEAISEFMYRTAQEGEVKLSQDKLDEFISNFVKRVASVEDMGVPKYAYAIFAEDDQFKLTEKRVIEIFKECMGGIGYKVRRLVNVDAIRNSLNQIFTWIPGERIINPEFGSRVRFYLYEPITSVNEEKIMAEIRRCVTEWEPRVSIEKIERLTDINDIENSTSKVMVIFKVIGLDDEQFQYTI